MRHQETTKVVWSNPRTAKTKFRRWTTVIATNICAKTTTTNMNRAKDKKRGHSFRKPTITRSNHQTTCTTAATRTLSAKILATSFMIPFKANEGL